MTSFYPSTPQSFDLLKEKPPSALVYLGHEDVSVPVERLWLGMAGKEGRALAVGRDEKRGVELTRYGSDQTNVLLQVLSDHWGCEIVSEYGDERFVPGSSRA